MLQKLKTLFLTEPARVVAVIKAAAGLAAALGFAVADSKVAAVCSFVFAVSALAAGEIVRKHVTPSSPKGGP